MEQKYGRPAEKHYKDSPELKRQVNKSKVIHTLLPKQTDLNKILKIIERKILKVTYLPMPLTEVQAGYLASPYFKNIFLYLTQNILPSSKVAVRQVEMQTERYLFLDSLLFRIQNFHEEQKPVLCIAESCVDHIFDLYHNSLFGAHQGLLVC